ncbi:hypothetical protein TRE132_21570 [Pseudomonas chlororaphis subsp. aurantiaca]|nr:hypothetical protein TRE132_21570 [Pseudomonas chlororaphis subsp. aurantiaca]
MTAINKEAVGLAYSLQGMLHAKHKTWEAITQIAARIQPGMLESQARALGLEVLAELGMDRIWHPALVRFGANTLKTFKQRSEGDPALGDNDIFFIDLGAVWDRHEGDCGATFVTGNDIPRCKPAPRQPKPCSNGFAITGASTRWPAPPCIAMPKNRRAPWTGC